MIGTRTASWLGMSLWRAVYRFSLHFNSRDLDFFISDPINCRTWVIWTSSIIFIFFRMQVSPPHWETYNSSFKLFSLWRTSYRSSIHFNSRDLAFFSSDRMDSHTWIIWTSSILFNSYFSECKYRLLIGKPTIPALSWSFKVFNCPLPPDNFK